VGAVCSPELVEGSTAIYSIGQTLANVVSYERQASGLKSGQFNRERNFEKANNEYRTRNIECRSNDTLQV
jgi:hypothetical protein